MRAARPVIRLFSFQKQFKPHIKSGRKRHTIRGKRRYPAKPGDALHLYTGLRTKYARIIMRTSCTEVHDIRIALAPGGVPVIYIDGEPLGNQQAEELAYKDGFHCLREMMQFWEGRLPFSGDIIHWEYPPKRGRRVRK